MAIFRNDFREDRVVPHIGYQLVPDGQTVTVADDEAHHWVAGGWTRVDETPAAVPAKTKQAAAAAEEGGE
jgi:hypothetical protein